MSDFDEGPSTAIDDLTGDYQLDTAHTRLGFVARHAMVTKVHGTFHEIEGRAHLDTADPSKSSAEVTVQMDSVDTGHEQRDAHLRTNDFFDVPNYPTMTFRSTEVKKLDDTTFRVTGDLTIKDTTRPVSIDFEFTGSAKPKLRRCW